MIRYPDNCPPLKISLQFRLGFGSRSGLVLGLGGNQTIAPEENCPPVKVRVWLRVSFWVEGCAFHFVEMWSVFWLYHQNGLEFLN